MQRKTNHCQKKKLIENNFEKMNVKSKKMSEQENEGNLHLSTSQLLTGETVPWKHAEQF